MWSSLYTYITYQMAPAKKKNNLITEFYSFIPSHLCLLYMSSFRKSTKLKLFYSQELCVLVCVSFPFCFFFFVFVEIKNVYPLCETKQRHASLFRFKIQIFFFSTTKNTHRSHIIMNMYSSLLSNPRMPKTECQYPQGQAILKRSGRYVENKTKSECFASPTATATTTTTTTTSTTGPTSKPRTLQSAFERNWWTSTSCISYSKTFIGRFFFPSFLLILFSSLIIFF